MDTTSPPENTPHVTEEKHSSVHEFLSTLGVLVSALLVAFLLIAFVFQSYQVDGPSMQNTLHDKDRLIVWKLPRTWARLTGHAYVPKRGDIVIVSEHDMTPCNQLGSRQIIKRVIGLPGDRVVVGDGVITIYNKQHPDGFEPDKTLPYGKDIPFTSGNVEYTLGPDEIFVNGDNRGNSCDSRELGPVKLNAVIGKLLLRLYPLNTAERF